MVLTHINRALIYLAAASLWLAARCPSRGIPAERTPRAVTPAQRRGIATAVNSPNVLRRRTRGRRRETRAGQLPASRPRRRSTTGGFARRSTGRRKPVTGTRMPAAAVSSRWIVRPAPRCTRAAWISAAVWTACSRRCFSVS